jgi:hypothetical protein
MTNALWLLPNLLAANTLASSGTIDAREAFEIVLPDGGGSGRSPLSFLLPLAGQDRALPATSTWGSDPWVARLPMRSSSSAALLIASRDGGVNRN